MSDTEIRLAAFDRLAMLCKVYGDDIPWGAIAEGFSVAGENILFANKVVGIFSPKQMVRGVLSIKTTKPRPGRVNVYEDQEGPDGDFIYSLQGDDPNNHYNRSLREALEDKAPLIYFHAVSSGVYKAIYPCFIESIDEKSMKCRVTVGQSSDTDYVKIPESLLLMPDQIERRYAVREAKVRLHQATFREMVLSAYGRKCAMTSLPVPELLEAAHIIPDSHADGISAVKNGLCLSRIHHRAFDSNLLGVTPDLRIEVSRRLLDMTDGPILEAGIKALHGKKIDTPKDEAMKPDPQLLERRYATFAAWKWSD